LSLLVATVLVLLLGIAGVERINEVLFVVVLVVAALAGGGLVRLLAPRLPAVRRPPRG
jgi:undecaprenyl pyrophosphate phosphatase UppP